MPALIALTVLTIFVLGPLMTELPLAKYFGNHHTYLYFKNNLLYPIYFLPGLFSGNVYPNAVNGSLWSLPVEVFMYIITPALIGYNLKKAPLLVIIASFSLCFFGIYFLRIHPNSISMVIYGSSVVSFLDAAPYYLVGMVYAVFRLDKFSRPAVSLCLLFIAALTVANSVVGEVLLMLLLPYAVISIGGMRIRALNFLLERGDFSYGLYLYGFVVQQTVTSLFSNKLNPIGNAAISWPIALIFAVISWFWIEKRALAWKSKIHWFMQIIYDKASKREF